MAVVESSLAVVIGPQHAIDHSIHASQCSTSEFCANMADRFKNLAKNGWHPEKSKTSGPSATSDSKLGQVVGFVFQVLYGHSIN